MIEQKRYKISVVTAVYNVGDYLEEMIQSILRQTIGIRNIQLILVDDGSFDGSEIICDYYAAQYPDNILVIHKVNGGVSSARNEGLRHAMGEYVNFTDADDLLDADALKKMYCFLEKNRDRIDLTAIPLHCYGTDECHPLHYKFTKTRIVDLHREYTCIQLSISSALIKIECFRDRQFDPKLSYAEDAQLLIDLLLDKMKYGIVCDTCYQYRKRASNDSALDRGRREKSYYIPYMKNFILYSLVNAENRKGRIPRFVQYTCMYDLQWRLLSPLTEPGILSMQEEQEYRALVLQAICRIDDHIIQEQKNIGYDEKRMLLSLKRDNRETTILLEFLTITQDCIRVEGYVRSDIPIQETQLIIRLSAGTEVFTTYTTGLIEKERESCLSLDSGPLGSFCLNFRREELRKQTDIRLFLCSNGREILCKNIRFGKFFPLSDRFQNSYLYKDGILITQCPDCLHMAKYPTRRQIWSQERRLSIELLSKNDKQVFRGWVVRRLYHLLKLLKRRELWLISDRITKADDNGEAFFTYMNTEGKNAEIKTYFVLDRSSEDHERLKNIGQVVPYHSLKHKILSLLCDKKISSQADEFVFNRFFDLSDMFKDIQYQQRFIFLQHGVTKDDSSTWLKRSDVDISLFITATWQEYRSILDFSYGYDENKVRCTGFPRYDYLYDVSGKERFITFVPTWRLYLTGRYDEYTDIRAAKDGFANSIYCRMYREVFSDMRLLEAAKRYGYIIQVMPHPSMPREYISDLGITDQIRVLERCTRYREVFAKSRLMITDYSSAVFDFAYLRKPVLYYQADAEEFFSGKHVYRKGYFDYERDGFGEVAYTAEELVEKIIVYLQDECQMEEIYQKRVENTFRFHDCRNCERVYKELRKL